MLPDELQTALEPSIVLSCPFNNVTGLPVEKSRPALFPKYQILASPCPRQKLQVNNNRGKKRFTGSFLQIWEI